MSEDTDKGCNFDNSVTQKALPLSRLIDLTYKIHKNPIKCAEDEHLLSGCGEHNGISNSTLEDHHDDHWSSRNYDHHPETPDSPSTRLLPQSFEMRPTGHINHINNLSNDTLPTTLPSIMINNVDNSDNPPRYVDIMSPDHTVWPPYDLEVPYSLRSDERFYPTEPIDPNSPALLSPYSHRIFGFGTRRPAFTRYTAADFPNDKIMSTKSRRYGGILLGAAVIFSLMLLSLAVRFIVEKTLLRG